MSESPPNGSGSDTGMSLSAMSRGIVFWGEIVGGAKR